jgi:NAD(P)-dependent dehydrogenase (short-subunit alcohol dehydrogenase family)
VKTVVITGSTRGIGYGLADSFLALGCAVTISGRMLASVEEAVAELSAKNEADRVLGHPCVPSFVNAICLSRSLSCHLH